MNTYPSSIITWGVFVVRAGTNIVNIKDDQDDQQTLFSGLQLLSAIAQNFKWISDSEQHFFALGQQGIEHE